MTKKKEIILSGKSKGLEKDAVFEAICSELETSWEGLTIICPRHKVSRAVFYDWRDSRIERTDRYARARERQMDYLEDLLFVCTMEKGKDQLTDGTINIGANVIARARLQTEVIRFVLGKLRSHKWGDKLQVEVKSEPRVFKID